MAKKTRGQLTHDLILRLTKGKPSADFDFPEEQIWTWLDEAANQLISDKLTKQIARGFDVDNYYIQKSGYLSAASESLSEVGSQYERYLVDISSLSILPVMAHERDYGILRINDENNAQVTNVIYDDDDYIDNLWFSASDDNNEKYHWYREGSNVVIRGLSSNSVSTKKFRLFYIGVIDSSALASDSITYPIGEDLLPMVLDIAQTIAEKQLQGGVYDINANQQIAN